MCLDVSNRQHLHQKLDQGCSIYLSLLTHHAIHTLLLVKNNHYGKIISTGCSFPL
jgi:hypothetical protein